jgi:hypothetical protein
MRPQPKVIQNKSFVADLWVNHSTGEVKKSQNSPGSGWRKVENISVAGRTVNDIMSDLVRVIPGGMATATQVMGMGVSPEVITDLKNASNLNVSDAGTIITVTYK